MSAARAQARHAERAVIAEHRRAQMLSAQERRAPDRILATQHIAQARTHADRAAEMSAKRASKRHKEIA
jgi:hypothetical protein